MGLEWQGQFGPAAVISFVTLVVVACGILIGVGTYKGSFAAMAEKLTNLYADLSKHKDQTRSDFGEIYTKFNDIRDDQERYQAFNSGLLGTMREAAAERQAQYGREFSTKRETEAVELRLSKSLDQINSTVVRIENRLMALHDKS